MTYQYRCTACGYRWELEQRITDAREHHCPACEKPTAKREVTGGNGFLLSGSGWARDGYAKGKGQ